MKNLEIGNYIRAGTAGIKKITAITKDVTGTIKNVVDEKGMFVNIKYISKAEPSIMKLIELGDYVNGRKVDRITNTGLGLDYCEGCEMFMECILNEEEIVDVLTKEQFNSRKFKVKGG